MSDRPQHAEDVEDADRFLVRQVGRFVRDGLAAGDTVVLFATEEHRAALLEDVLPTGRVIARDAPATLEAILVGGRPDRARFAAEVGAPVTAAVRDAGSGRVRVYGELVDLLRRDGRRDAALELEEMWNELLAAHPITLLCAHAAAELEARDVLEAELRRSRDALRESDRRKDAFLALLGHELRNPLAPILSALELMRRRGESHAERERAVIERQVRHMMRLVDDLLDVSRVTRGKVKLEREPVELATVVARAVEATAPLFEERGQTLEVDVPRSGLLLHADPFRLAQVVANLLANAAKYSASGARAFLEASREGGTVVLSVRDEGAGISPELLPAIFELFVQHEQGSDRSQGGLGLGLAIAQAFVALHGGTISAASDGPGKGSTFTVRLPAVVLEPREPAAPPPGRAARRAARVLVVDDNADAADLLAEGLRLLDHDVLVAGDGPTALRVAAHAELDAVVLDIGLPGMDGHELARRLREQQRGPLLLIAVTGYGQEADRLRSRDAGIDLHLVKPVDLDTLASALAG
jgi:signal transduction histidine kinase